MRIQFRILSLITFGTLICHAQHRLTAEPINIQKEYFRRFVLYGECGDATTTCEELAAVARTSQWVLPMLEPALVEARRDEQANRKKFLKLLYMIVDIGNKEALDVVARVLDGHSEEVAFLRAALTESPYSRRLNHFDLLYFALEHKDPTVRKVAEEEVWIRIDDPSEGRQRIWAEAALRRYSHPPSVADWQTDPIMRLLWTKHPYDASERQKHITVLAEESKKTQ